MEKKTIGSFLAALRRASGMTQKELAEKLHVSDKSVSRWERDEGAPDLSMIPAIAEIFDVTCDELLRGERKSPAQQGDTAAEGELTKKSEKQRKRLLAASLSSYKTRTLIAMGISGLGTICAMGIDLGFLHGTLAFFAGAAFFLVSVVAQAISANHAFLSVSDDSLGAGEIGPFKRSVVRWAERSFGLTAFLIGFTLIPLALLNDAYVGLRLDSWLFTGAIFGAAALALFFTACYFVNGSLVKRDMFALDETEHAVYARNHRLKGICTAVWAAALACTVFAHLALTEIWGPRSIMEGTTFDDYERFIAFMETDVPAVYYDESGNVSREPESEPGSEAVYMDEYGDEITEEEWEEKNLRRTLTDKNGNVVCAYIDRNKSVCSVRYTETGDGILPITVCTNDDLEKAQEEAGARHILFGIVYVLECVGAFAVYFFRRSR